MITEAKGFHVEYETVVEAPREVVFDTMVRVNEWFPHRFKAGAPYVQDPTVGGFGIEDWGGGEGALFSITTFIRRPDIWVVMDMPGVFGSYFGTSTHRFEEVDGGTKVKVSVYGVGDVTEKNANMFEQGYPGIFDALRKYLADKA